MHDLDPPTSMSGQSIPSPATVTLAMGSRRARSWGPSTTLRGMSAAEGLPIGKSLTVMKVIDEDMIRGAVAAPDALASAERAFRALAADAVELPDPVGFRIPDVDGEVHVKSAYLTGASIYAVKIASGFYRNPERGLPTGYGLIVVFDAGTGLPLAVLNDGGYLTELRTAAAGALAADLLAPHIVEVVGVLGTGMQARYQVRALAGVRDWERTVVWSPNPEHVRAYSGEMQKELGIAFKAAAGPQEAVADADLVITVTPSRTPLIEAAWLRPDATVIAVGSDGPDKRELPTEALVRADKIVVDRLTQCIALGELHHAITEGALDSSSVYGELGDVVVGRLPGREGEELIICDLTGVGAQDAAIAEVAWNRLTSS